MVSYHEWKIEINSGSLLENKMKRRTFLKTVPAITMLAGTTSGFAKDLQPITLLKPQTEGGKSVLSAIQERKTNRNISAKQLPPQMLSNLLWAAFGVNREKASFGKTGRTAASASNSQEIDLYVALPEGVYLYEAVPHRLKPVIAGDFRRRSGRRSAARAPVNIFYVVSKVIEFFVQASEHPLNKCKPDKSSKVELNIRRDLFKHLQCIRTPIRIQAR